MKIYATTYTNKQNNSKIISYILPWIQFFHIYAFATGITLGYAIVVLFDAIFILYSIIGRKKLFFSDTHTKIFLLFIIYLIISLPISIFLSGHFLLIGILNKILKLLCLAVLIYFSGSYIDFNLYKKSLKLLTYIACFAVFFQMILRLTTGGYTSFKLPFLSFANEDTNIQLQEVTTSTRYRSIFTEPSHFVYFVFQYLCILLFDDTIDFKKCLIGLVISACIILCVSSTGIVLLVLVWSLFIFLLLQKNKNNRKTVFLFIFIISVLCLMVFYYLNNKTLSFSLYRLTSNYDRSAIVWKRLYACFDDFESMSFVQKIFGYGLGNINNEFMNSFVYLLRTVGVIGTLMVVLWFVFCFFSSNNCGKAATIVFFALCCIDLTFFTPTLLGYLVIILFNKRVKSNGHEFEK